MRALTRLWDGLEDGHRALALQLLRYGVVGVGVTLFQIAIYNALIAFAHLGPGWAVTLATVAAMLVGYTIHSRFTFDGHGTRGNEARAVMRFVAASMVGFGANLLWVWVLTTLLGLPHWTPSLPMFFATPALLFWLNRKWVFD